MENRGQILMRYLAELVNASLENRTPYAIPTALSVEEILDIADKGQIRYLIYSALSKVLNDGQTADRLQSKIVRSTFKSLTQMGCVHRLQELFEQAEIPFQVLKGAVMKQLYPKPEYREMGDIDLIVFEDSIHKADEILRAEGFAKIEEVKHHAVYKKAPFVILEVHWDLIDKSVDSNQYTYFKQENRSTLKPGKQYEYEFDREQFYVYMIAHMAKHFYETGCGIRNLVDIYVYREKYKEVLDFDVIDRELDKCGLKQFEAQVSRLAYVWLTGENADEIQEFLFVYMVDCGIYGKTENGIWSQLAETGTDMGQFIKHPKLWHIFPNSDYMKKKYKWLERYPYLLPFAWLMRMGRALGHPSSMNRQRELGKMNSYEVKRYCQMYQTLGLNYKK